MKSNSNRNGFSVAGPRGFLAGTAACGLKSSGADLAIIFSERPAVAAAVFTQNLVQAAPVQISRENLRHRRHRAILVNSGGANACTGAAGLADARHAVSLVAEHFALDDREVLIASTGVIGTRLDMKKVEQGIRHAAAGLSRSGGAQVAEAIMTTDTRPKRSARSLTLDGQRVTIAGVAKGAGMIHPNMATLLAFVTTDAAISKTALQSALKRAVNESFNCVTVDGDTSTNDTLAILANGAGGNATISRSSGPDYDRFAAGLTAVCQDLAIEVARDGEGARKLITVNVRRAPTMVDARRIAQAVATSPLVKTAIAGEDPNWGRIIAAAGRSGAQFDPALVEVDINGLVVARQGRGVRFNEEKAAGILARNEVGLTIDLHQGEASTSCWTCDLTEDYIKINAEYRS
jgi:glutamate N-acetyltransferase / amino-acid N-acetyltransferase